jgi:hypothetical protein
MGSQVYAALMRTKSGTERRRLPRCLAEGFAGIFAAYLIESVTGNPMTQLILLSYVVVLALAACQSARHVAVAPIRRDSVEMGRRPEPIRG